MKVSLEGVRCTRGAFSLEAAGTFGEGTHLVSGDVGSGKTTLALLLAGRVLPSAGSVRPEGIRTTMISFQFPEYHVTGATVRDECRSWGRDPAAILAAAGLTGTEERCPLTLSRGELKRLHLACLLTGRYDLLVLDEPFSSLDCREKERACQELSVRRQGITIIFTHEQEFLPRVDCLWEIAGGSLCCRGPLPGAIPEWEHAPAIFRALAARGRCPHNLTREDILEAACRM